jgi:hypothetical protein
VSIVPTLLIEQVRMAAPFVFEGPEPGSAASRYIRVLRAYDGGELNALQYYELCLCAHWATAGSFMPTDVDNGIRWKHWQSVQPGLVEEQAKLVLEALGWDYAPVTAKITGTGPRRVSTHEGTWFSVAVGAYAACLEAKPAFSTVVLDAMRSEAEREDRVYAACGDGIERLKTSALIAHNFGDLDRVVDQWELKPGDALRLALYDAAKPGSPLFGGRLGRAGVLHQKYMGADNHRHYPLRAARGLRKSADLLLPVGPFFDDWGRKIGKHPALTPGEVAEAVRCLLDGWARLHEPAGYARALSGILEVFSGGRRALIRLLPSKDGRMLESGSIKTAIDVSQERFEAQWANRVAKASID